MARPAHTGTVKTKSLDQIEKMQAKAVRFLRDVADDPDRADEFEAMSPEEYAEHRGIEIVSNPSQITIRIRRRTAVAKPTRADLEDRVEELEEENQALNDKLDSILDIVEEDEGEDEAGEATEDDDAGE